MTVKSGGRTTLDRWAGWCLWLAWWWPPVTGNHMEPYGNLGHWPLLPSLPSQWCCYRRRQSGLVYQVGVEQECLPNHLPGIPWHSQISPRLCSMQIPVHNIPAAGTARLMAPLSSALILYRQCMQAPGMTAAVARQLLADAADWPDLAWPVLKSQSRTWIPELPLANTSLCRKSWEGEGPPLPLG